MTDGNAAGNQVGLMSGGLSQYFRFQFSLNREWGTTRRVGQIDFVTVDHASCSVLHFNGQKLVALKFYGFQVHISSPPGDCMRLPPPFR